MSVAELKLARNGTGMDRQIHHKPWSPAAWPLGARVGAAAGAGALAVLAIVAIFVGSGVRSVCLPLQQATVTPVENAIFHDFIPLRAKVVPRDTVYIDAIDGGRVDHVLVQAGDVVEAGQPLIELSNTNLPLQVIQQESQLNQAISQLEQNEIALEQNKLANERALAEIEYNITRLARATERRAPLMNKGFSSVEEHDKLSDELALNRRLRPIQAGSGERKEDLRNRLLPGIHDQLVRLRVNGGEIPGQRGGVKAGQ